MRLRFLIYFIPFGFFLMGFTNIQTPQNDVGKYYISEHPPPTQSVTTAASEFITTQYKNPVSETPQKQENPTQGISVGKELFILQEPIASLEEKTFTEEIKQSIDNNQPGELDKASSEETIEAKESEATIKSLTEEALYQKEHFELTIPESPKIEYWVSMYSEKMREPFEISLSRFDRVSPVMEKIFEDAGLPKDLVYLSLIESGGKCNARSHAGAVGYWQFMPGTAKVYGLRVDKWVDERKNLEKSTLAATNYLKNLYSEFNDWYLACAAYNSGEGKLRRLMKSNPEVNSFWDINNSMSIKNETLNFVPKLLAALTIGKNRETYGLENETESALPMYDEVAAPPFLLFTELSDATGISVSELSELNPELIKKCTPPSPKEFILKVPEGMGETVSSYLAKRKKQQASYITYTTKKGDTLFGIARRYNSSASKIAKTNKMNLNAILPVGKTILIPTTNTYASAGEGT